MIALWILLGIVVFFGLILFFPLHISAKYDESLALSIRYLFIKIGFPKKPLTPEQEEKKKKKKEKKAEKKKRKKEKKAEKKKKKQSGEEGGKEKKKSGFKEIFERHGVSGLLSILKDAVALLKKNFKKLRHTKIAFLSIDMVIAKGNAADTAIEYGKTCAAVYPSVSELLSICPHGRYEIAVTPNFNSQKSVTRAEAHLKIRVFHLVSLALGILFGSIKLYFRFRRGKYEKRKKPDIQPENKEINKNTEKEKGGAENEQSD